MLQNHQEEIRDLVDKIGELDSGDNRYLLLRGELLRQDGHLEDAISYFEKVLSSDDDNVMALTRLVIIYHELENPERVQFFLRASEERIHDHPQCWRGLSDAYRALGDDKKLISILEKGTQIDIGSAAPWIALAQEYEHQNMVDESIYAWSHSFELRGYVKIFCSTCNNYFSIPYNPNTMFDFHRAQTCPTCVCDIPMPDGLSPI